MQLVASNHHLIDVTRNGESCINWQLFHFIWFDFCRFAQPLCPQNGRDFFSGDLICIGFRWSFTHTLLFIACTIQRTNEWMKWMICLHRVHWFSKIHMFDTLAKCSSSTLTLHSLARYIITRTTHTHTHTFSQSVSNGVWGRIYDDKCMPCTMQPSVEGYCIGTATSPTADL